MNAIDKAQQLLSRQPRHPDAVAIATLIQALQEEGPFDLGTLYGLDLDTFELAMQIMEDWRLQRYYLGHAAAVTGKPRWSGPQ